MMVMVENIVGGVACCCYSIFVASVASERAMDDDVVGELL